MLSTALTTSSIGASSIALDTLGLVCCTDPDNVKSVAPGVYVSITTFAFLTLSKRASLAINVPVAPPAPVMALLALAGLNSVLLSGATTIFLTPDGAISCLNVLPAVTL